MVEGVRPVACSPVLVDERTHLRTGSGILHLEPEGEGKIAVLKIESLLRIVRNRKEIPFIFLEVRPYAKLPLSRSHPVVREMILSHAVSPQCRSPAHPSRDDIL